MAVSCCKYIGHLSSIILHTNANTTSDAHRLNRQRIGTSIDKHYLPYYSHVVIQYNFTDTVNISQWYHQMSLCPGLKTHRLLRKTYVPYSKVPIEDEWCIDASVHLVIISSDTQLSIPGKAFHHLIFTYFLLDHYEHTSIKIRKFPFKKIYLKYYLENVIHTIQAVMW